MSSDPKDKIVIGFFAEPYPNFCIFHKIGQLKIQVLRDKAQAELRDQFNIREFHTQVLETGAVPLQLLEDKINRWISEVKNSES